MQGKIFYRVKGNECLVWSEGWVTKNEAGLIFIASDASGLWGSWFDPKDLEIRETK